MKHQHCFLILLNGEKESPRDRQGKIGLEWGSMVECALRMCGDLGLIPSTKRKVKELIVGAWVPTVDKISNLRKL